MIIKNDKGYCDCGNDTFVKSVVDGYFKCSKCGELLGFRLKESPAITFTFYISKPSIFDKIKKMFKWKTAKKP